VLNEAGRYREAIDAFSKVRKGPLFDHLPEAYAGTAYALGRLGALEESIGYYRKALDLNADASLYRSLGLAVLSNGDREGAVTYFRKALDLNPGLTSIYLQLIALYQELGRQDEAQKMRAVFEKVKSVNEGEEHFRNGTRAYLSGSFDAAAEEFQKSIAGNPFNPASYSNLGYVYFDRGMLDRAYECQEKALDLDPGYANAHYGLALIHKRWGSAEKARKHWKEYLRIEPAGYFARKAREELQALR